MKIRIFLLLAVAAMLIFLIAGMLQSQVHLPPGKGYVTKGELDDSLAGKLDTSAVAAGDNVTVDWDGSSLTIASSGSGGGSYSFASVVIGQSLGDYVQDTLNAVLDSAITDLVDTGGVVFISGGTYYVDADSITLTQNDTVVQGVYLVGEPGRTIIKYTNGAGSKYLFVSTNARALAHFHLRDIEIVADTNAVGLWKDNGEADSVSFEDLVVRDFTNASAWPFASNNTTSSSFYKVINCDFINNRFVPIPWRFSSVVNCRVAPGREHGIVLSPTASYSEIRGCLVDSFGVAGSGLLIQSPYSYIVNCTVTRPDSGGDAVGIRILSTSSFSKIENNYVGNPALGKIMLMTGVAVDASGCVLGNNYIYGARLRGVRLEDNGDNSMAIDNRLENCVVGIEVVAGAVKAGHTENIFHDVGTNVTDNGTDTINGDTRDLD